MMAQAARPQIARDLTAADLTHALVAGWRDFISAPLFGLFFGGIYVAAGIGLYFLAFVKGEVALLIPAAAGFPLLAPFVAVGLYEVSRRREQAQPLRWRAILGAIRGRGDGQLWLMGGIVFVGFSFWVIIAHTIFAIFVAGSPAGESLAFLATQEGIAMLIVGGAVGAGIAFIFYAITLMSLPMLVDRDVDFITAIITSFGAIGANTGVLMSWAVIIAVALFIAMLPLFLGLLVVLPVLGHATWHLYRRVVI